MKQKIIEKVSDAFLKENPNQSSIYIFYIIESGMVLYEDCDIGNKLLISLIKDNTVKQENGIYYHQGLRCIRYKFNGYIYPKKFYRNIDKHLRDQVMHKYNYKCKQCNSRRNLTIDHIIPWSLGGFTTYDNLQVLCNKCNSSKGNR